MGTYTELLQLDRKQPKPKAPGKLLVAKKKSPTTKKVQPQKPASNIESNIASKQAIKIASNIAILQEDVQALREPATIQRTFRLTKEEIDWLVEASYQLSKGFNRGKVSQVDVLRVGLKLFKNILSTNKNDLLKLLEAIK